jgi:hypothetical protein
MAKVRKKYTVKVRWPEAELAAEREWHRYGPGEWDDREEAVRNATELSTTLPFKQFGVMEVRLHPGSPGPMGGGVTVEERSIDSTTADRFHRELVSSAIESRRRLPPFKADSPEVLTSMDECLRELGPIADRIAEMSHEELKRALALLE